jgi:hypothetical protein
MTNKILGGVVAAIGLVAALTLARRLRSRRNAKRSQHKAQSPPVTAEFEGPANLGPAIPDRVEPVELEPNARSEPEPEPVIEDEPQAQIGASDSSSVVPVAPEQGAAVPAFEYAQQLSPPSDTSARGDLIPGGEPEPEPAIEDQSQPQIGASDSSSAVPVAPEQGAAVPASECAQQLSPPSDKSARGDLIPGGEPEPEPAIEDQSQPQIGASDSSSTVPVALEQGAVVPASAYAQQLSPPSETRIDNAVRFADSGIVPRPEAEPETQSAASGSGVRQTQIVAGVLPTQDSGSMQRDEADGPEGKHARGPAPESELEPHTKHQDSEVATSVLTRTAPPQSSISASLASRAGTNITERPYLQHIPGQPCAEDGWGSSCPN